jgi:hypothetical protein
VDGLIGCVPADDLLHLLAGIIVVVGNSCGIGDTLGPALGGVVKGSALFETMCQRGTLYL